jgi:hypothetical protein
MHTPLHGVTAVLWTACARHIPGRSVGCQPKHTARAHTRLLQECVLHLKVRLTFMLLLLLLPIEHLCSTEHTWLASWVAQLWVWPSLSTW